MGSRSGRGGSGGSRSGGGGFRSSGSSFRSSSSIRHHSSHHHHHGGGIHIHTRVGSSSSGPISPYQHITSRYTIFIVFGFMFMIMALISAISFGSDATDQKIYYEQHQMMIERALADPSYRAQAIVTDTDYDYDYDKYYYSYSVFVPGNPDRIVLKQETFAMYDKDEIVNITPGQIVDVAINSTNVQTATNSINMDYANVSLKEEPGYSEPVRARNISIAIIVAIIAGEAALIVSMTKKIKKFKQEQENNKNNINTTNQTNEKYCVYCGSKLIGDTSKCSVCGANQTKN